MVRTHQADVDGNSISSFMTGTNAAMSSVQIDSRTEGPNSRVPLIWFNNKGIRLVF